MVLVVILALVMLVDDQYDMQRVWSQAKTDAQSVIMRDLWSSLIWILGMVLVVHSVFPGSDKLECWL